MASLYGLELFDFDNNQIDKQLTTLLPESIARRFCLLAVSQSGQTPTIAFAHPQDIIAKDEMSRRFPKGYKIVLAKESELIIAIDSLYRNTNKILALTKQLESQISQMGSFEQIDDIDDEQQSPVVSLISSIFDNALQLGASDIHIEPQKDSFRLRFRIDGILQDQINHDNFALPAIVSRLKLMAKLNISEKRLPQDGRFSISVDQRLIDIRMSTLPVSEGESLVLRLLDKSAGVLDIPSLGMPPLVKKTLIHHIQAPYGMILVTGPTGAGKTTTLYACLEAIKSSETKIITAEDPIEYAIEGINQVQVAPQSGLDFARILRSALRQDPDVVMVGEIRDKETAQVAVQAALTGHLVFSTLHTNDSIGATERLVNIGLEPFLVAAAVKLVLAQRLVRRLCPHCSLDYEPKELELQWIGQSMNVDLPRITLKQARGCQKCSHTGYQGRLGVYEFLTMDEKMAFYLRQGELGSFAQYAQKHPSYRPLSQWALDYAISGQTSLEEVFRVSGGQSLDEYLS